MQIVSWVLTVFALYGTWLNAKQDINGFWFWLLTDIAFASYFASLHMWAQSFLFSVYAILAVKGLLTWSKN